MVSLFFSLSRIFSYEGIAAKESKFNSISGGRGVGEVLLLRVDGGMHVRVHSYGERRGILAIGFENFVRRRSRTRTRGRIEALAMRRWWNGTLVSVRSFSCRALQRSLLRNWYRRWRSFCDGLWTCPKKGVGLLTCSFEVKELLCADRESLGRLIEGSSWFRKINNDW